jgi:hypothetical protein
MQLRAHRLYLQHREVLSKYGPSFVPINYDQPDHRICSLSHIADVRTDGAKRTARASWHRRWCSTIIARIGSGPF